LVRLQTAYPTPLEQVRPDVPPGLPALVRKVLAKKPDERLQSATEFVRALDDALAGGSRATPRRAATNQNTPANVRKSLSGQSRRPIQAPATPTPAAQEDTPREVAPAQPTTSVKEAPPAPELWQKLHEEEPSRPKSGRKPRPTEDAPVRRKAERKPERPGKALPGRSRRHIEIPSWLFPVVGTLVVVLVFGVGGGFGFYHLYQKYGQSAASSKSDGDKPASASGPGKK
jgi:type IV secretory pathway VirB10-like protein